MDEQAAPTPDQVAAPEGAAPEAPADAAAPSAADVQPPPADASASTDAAVTDATAPQTPPTTETEPLGPDPLAKLEDDNSAFILGMIPLVFMGLFAIACVILYLVRRRKNWNELDEVMKIDGGDTPIGADSHFTTQDMQEMEPTRPSQRMSEIND